MTLRVMAKIDHHWASDEGIGIKLKINGWCKF